MSEITIHFYWTSVLFGWALGVLTPFVFMLILAAIQGVIRRLSAHFRP